MFEIDNYVGVTPSGVEFEVSELLTSDQGRFFKDSQKNNNHIPNLVWAKLERLGNVEKGDISKAFVRKMLYSDLLYIAFKLRNYSFQDETEFEFNVEFPKSKRDKMKLVEKHMVDLSSFETKPCLWVRNKINELDKKHKDGDEFPIMYESYEEMMEEQYSRTFIMPRVEKVIRWSLLTWDSYSSQKDSIEQVDDYTKQLYLRKTQVEISLGKQGDSEEKEWRDIPWDDISANVQESFRKHYMNIEANVDLIIQIRSEKNPEKTVAINLAMVGEFYSPSMGLA